MAIIDLDRVGETYYKHILERILETNIRLAVTQGKIEAQKELREQGLTDEQIEQILGEQQFDIPLSVQQNSEDLTISPDELKAISKYVADYMIEAAKQGNETPGKKSREKAAESVGELVPVPNKLFTPTIAEYIDSLRLGQPERIKGGRGNAHIQAVTDPDSLTYKDGLLSIGKIPESMKAELRRGSSKEVIENIDLSLLRSFYSIMCKDFEESGYTLLRDRYDVYAPELLQVLGLGGGKQSIGSDSIKSLVKTLSSYNSILGWIKHSPTKQSFFQILNISSYNAQTGVISFSSPYLKYVLQQVYETAKKRDKRGNEILQSNGKALTRAYHSVLVKPSIYKARDAAAVENVFLIVQGIESHGNDKERVTDETDNAKCKFVKKDTGTYRVTPKYLIEHNQYLQIALENDSNKTRKLQRVFKRTWELLREETYLADVYKDIVLPDPKAPESIPTTKNLEKPIVITHKGKRKTQKV